MLELRIVPIYFGTNKIEVSRNWLVLISFKVSIVASKMTQIGGHFVVNSNYLGFKCNKNFLRRSTINKYNLRSTV